LDYPEAIGNAREKHACVKPKPNFLTLDICDNLPNNMQFEIFIDRGYLHGIPAILIDKYVSNISALASHDAKVLLMIRAFREGSAFGDESEISLHADRIKRIFSNLFSVESQSPTYLNISGKYHARGPLPGLVFRLKRSAP
jgi:hypothetical protein